MAKIEIVMDKKTGKFVVHYQGVSSHNEEHKITDKMIAKLQEAGYTVEVEHIHDETKTPKVPDAEEIKPQRQKVRS